MGRRPYFARDQCEWITDQLLRSREATRTPAVWRTLYAAFLTQFPNARDTRGDAITAARYKSYVLNVERRQESQQIARAVAHLRRHELFEQDQQALAQTPTQTRAVEKPLDEQNEIEIKEEPNGEEDEEEDVGEEEDDDDDEFFMVPVRAAPLLRTRATATAIAEQARQEEDTAITAETAAAPTPRRRGRPPKARGDHTSGSTAASAESVVSTERPRKRARPDGPEKAKAAPTVAVQPKLPGDGQSLRLRIRSAMIAEPLQTADEWKAKYKAAKATNDTLQARLTEALALLEAQEKQIKTLEAAVQEGTASATSSTSGSSALTFTIRVNVDVSQNGEPVRTTSHALRVDADTAAAS